MATPRPPSVVLAAVSVAVLVAQHVASRAARDALFLSNFPATELPKVMLAAAIVGLPAVLVSARLMKRFGPGRLIPGLLVASAALHGVEWALLGSFAPATAVILYLHASISTGIAISGFWSAVSERFDPHRARRYAGRLAAGSAAGGLVGGLFARWFGADHGPGGLLPLLGVASLFAAVAFGAFAGPTKLEPYDTEPLGARRAASSSYVRSLAFLVALTGLASAVVDFAFKTSVSSSPRSEGELVSFFALFYTATSVASVVLQLTVSRWALGSMGIGATLMALPVSVATLGLLGVFVPAGWAFVLVRGAGSALETSLFRSAYEPLYTPLPVAQRRQTKGLIDVACDRAGEVAGSSLVLAVSAFAPLLAPRAGLAIGAAAACVAVWLSVRLERGYVAELASSLRSGKLKIAEHEVADATTRLTLSQTQLELDRGALLRQIEELRRRGSLARGGAASDASDHALPDGRASSEESHALAVRFAELTSGDPVRIRAALEAKPLEHELVSAVLPLLADDRVVEQVTAALARVAMKNAGQLIDALLDNDRPLRLRRRLPRVLRACPSPRVVRGLAEALSDPEFVIRYRAALALRDLVELNHALRPPSALVIAAASHEVDVSHVVWKARADSFVADDPSDGVSRVALSDRALDHVFTLLGLAFDTEAVELARRALATDDLRLRGTALEYLEHIVPEPIRAGIWPHLQAGRTPGQAEPRPAAELVEELTRSFG